MIWFNKKPEAIKGIDDYIEGEQVRGTVVEFTSFGAYIDIYGLKAKLNREEISWSQIGSADHFLMIGQVINCVVLAANEKQGKFIVSMKRTRSDPWALDCKVPTRGEIVQGRAIAVFESEMIVEVFDGIHGRVRARDFSSEDVVESFLLHFQTGLFYKFLVAKVDTKKGALALLPIGNDIIERTCRKPSQGQEAGTSDKR